MATRQDLKDWVYRAIAENHGAARIVAVAKHIWAHHEAELLASGDLFYTWQYDMRWAAKLLRDEGKIASPDISPRGTWALRK